MKFLTAFLFTVLLTAASAAIASPLSASPLDRQDIQALIVDEARRQRFPAEVALGVAKIESNYQADVVSHKGAIGVMQIMPKTGLSEFGLEPSELYDPETNVRAGIAYLKSLYREYERMDIALSHYNGGSKVRHPSGTLQIIPATRSYVQRVLETARGLQREGNVARIASRDRRDRRPRFSVSAFDDQTRSGSRAKLTDFERGRFGSQWRSSRDRDGRADRRRSIYGTDNCDCGETGSWLADESVWDSRSRREQIREWESIYRN